MADVYRMKNIAWYSVNSYETQNRQNTAGLRKNPLIMTDKHYNENKSVINIKEHMNHYKNTKSHAIEERNKNRTSSHG